MKTKIIQSPISKYESKIFKFLLVLLLLLVHANLAAQPVPHHFSGITALPDGTVTLSLDGSVSNLFNLTGAISNQFNQMFDLYVVEASTDLANWTPLTRLLRTNDNPNPLLVQDTNTAGSSHRFYRILTNHLLTASPMPSGPFAVGTVDRVMVDPARTNLYRYTPPTNAFMVTFRYPADPPPAGTLPVGSSPRVAADTNMYNRFYSAGYCPDPRWVLITPALVGHRYRGVPVAAGTARYPVILYSHGLRAGRESASHVAEELASHGYVVIAIDHPDCWGSEFPDGRYLDGSRPGTTGIDVTGRLQDMQFLVDELSRLDSGDVLFAGRLDLDRIGVSGLSAGGMVIDTCRTDSRVKCAAIWDGTSYSQSTSGLQKPFLVALGESNLYLSSAQWLFNKATNNAVLLQVRGATHITGGDGAWTWEIPKGGKPALAFEACLVWFFDTYLKGEMPEFPANPEIYNVQRK